MRACASVLGTWVLCGGSRGPGPCFCAGQRLPGHKCPKAPPPGGALGKLAGAHHVAVGALAQASCEASGRLDVGAHVVGPRAGGRAGRAGGPAEGCLRPTTHNAALARAVGHRPGGGGGGARPLHSR